MSSAIQTLSDFDFLTECLEILGRHHKYKKKDCNIYVGLALGLKIPYECMICKSHTAFYIKYQGNGPLGCGKALIPICRSCLRKNDIEFYVGDNGRNEDKMGKEIITKAIEQ